MTKCQVPTNDTQSFVYSLGDIKNISNANKELCEAPVTVADIEDDARMMKLNKSLGNDGLTTQFSKLCPRYFTRFAQSIYREHRQRKAPFIFDSGVNHSQPQSTKGYFIAR